VLSLIELLVDAHTTLLPKIKVSHSRSAGYIILADRWSTIRAGVPASRIAHPTRYQLDLTLVPSEPEFQGWATIDIDLDEHTDLVWLNAKDLVIGEVSVEAAGTSSAARWQTTAEFLGMDLPAPLGPGRLRLRIRYSGKLSDSSNVGAYRKKAGNDWYIYTSFTPIDARRAFPCFDEPGYKAPWEVTLHVTRNQMAVANAPSLSEADEPGDMKRVVFAPTPPLPSEVVAFAVGPFDAVAAGVAGQKRVPVRIIVPRGRAAEAAAPSAATPDILTRLEQYTGIPYPWDKLDHLAVLNMPFGATENPGLITYRDRLLLAPPSQDTPQRQRFMRENMAHELAHQWFGNLVTQAWWDDVWLSEGFATWLGTKIGDMELPQFERGLRITAARNAMLASDSSGRRPVKLEMHSRHDTDDVYDGIVYQKGAAILEMLEDWVGPETFRLCLHRYLTDHRFGNAATSDLARALEQETGVTAGPVLSSFLDRAGTPVFRFRLLSAQSVAKLEIEQSGQPWIAPVCFHAEDIGGQCQVVSTSHVEMPLSGSPAWVWPNAYGSGYYRSLVTPGLLDSLVSNGYDQLTEPEQLALLGDLEGLLSTGDLPAGEVMKVLLQLVPKLGRTGGQWVEAQVAQIALKLAVAAPDSLRPNYADWLKDTLRVKPIAPMQGRSMEEFFREKR
jgi:alanyl aminopeptidase